MGEKIIHHDPVHEGYENLTLGVGISTEDPASLVPGRNSEPSGEIFLSYMDDHDGLLYSRPENGTAMRAEQPTKLCKPRRKMRVKVWYQ